MADIKQASKWMQEGKRVYSYDSQRREPLQLASNRCKLKTIPLSRACVTPRSAKRKFGGSFAFGLVK